MPVYDSVRRSDLRGIAVAADVCATVLYLSSPSAVAQQAPVREVTPAARDLKPRDRGPGAADPNGPEATAGKRVWTYNAGAVRLEAAFVKCEDYQVTLDKGNGLVVLPLTKLSAHDRGVVNEILRQRDHIPDDVVKVLEGFDSRRLKMLASLKDKGKDAISGMSKASNDEELRAFERYRSNPALGRVDNIWAGCEAWAKAIAP